MVTQYDRGLYGKFHVERVDGRDRPGGDRVNARYFVLDYVNDPFARPALQEYADEARACGYGQLAEDLEKELEETRRD